MVVYLYSLSRAGHTLYAGQNASQGILQEFSSNGSFSVPKKNQAGALIKLPQLFKGPVLRSNSQQIAFLISPLFGDKRSTHLFNVQHQGIGPPNTEHGCPKVLTQGSHAKRRGWA